MVRDENGTLGGGVRTQNPVTFRSAQPPLSQNSITLTALRVVFFALFENV